MRSIFVRKLTPLLKEALSERIVDFDFCIPHSQESPMQGCLNTEPVNGFVSCSDLLQFYRPVVLAAQWEVHEKPIVFPTEDDVSVLLGLRLAPKWNNPLTRGPPAKSAEAAHFREFWGDRCELRKYPDNAICETVAWNSPDVPLLIC
ncbi:unnamed protein product, partial [Gongylonema pulchrum]|uniref:Nucleolar protein 6 n=1 Tax=Gongylonema pulchrum TaxID=637853 RepID=A0A183DHC0_9BILA